MGMLAGATDCRKSRKWGCRGRLALVLKPRQQPYQGENHTALAEWGPCGGDTADGAGSLNHGLLLLFLRYSISDWAEGEGRTVHLWVF